jgi:hypothetical protein
LKHGDTALFPHLTKIVAILISLPCSNATVERLFSIMGVIKNKLRNLMAIPMVEAVLATRLGLKRRGETCANMTILPEMMRRFNHSMYDHRRVRPAEERVPGPAEREVDAENGDDDDMIQILNDVKDLLGEPVFVTL